MLRKTDDGNQPPPPPAKSQNQRTTRRPPGHTDKARHQRRRPKPASTDNQTRPPTSQRGANHQRRQPTGTREDGTTDEPADRRRRRHQTNAARQRAKNRAAADREANNHDRDNTEPEDKGTRRTTASTANTPKADAGTTAAPDNARRTQGDARVPQAQCPVARRGRIAPGLRAVGGSRAIMKAPWRPYSKAESARRRPFRAKQIVDTKRERIAATARTELASRELELRRGARPLERISPCARRPHGSKIAF